MSLHHNYHIVTFSPWPIYTAISAVSLLLSFINMFSGLPYLLGLAVSVLALSFSVSLWWRDVSREASLEGSHTKSVELGLRWGVILFIVSELLLFFSLFWGYFHSSLSSGWEGGMLWPVLGLTSVQAFEVPLLNTMILLSSGVTVTWAHHSLTSESVQGFAVAMIMTLILGVYFTMIQGWEYLEAGFGFSDSSFGSCFYLATGTHGCHVLVGTVFLMVMFTRALVQGHFSSAHHFGFEASAWYWHFVDVVWIGLFIIVYWWGG